MRTFATTLLASLFSIAAVAQSPSGFYGLARNSVPAPAIYLATVNAATGAVTNLSGSSLGIYYNLTGAALDPYGEFYHYLSPDGVHSVDLNTGAQTAPVALSNPLGQSEFDNFRFNNSDSSLYGLARRNYIDSLTGQLVGEIYLATLDPATGVIAQLSTTSVGQGYTLAGSAIDPHLKVYYYESGDSLVGLDMYTGGIYSKAPISFTGGGTYFDNFTYSCTDTTIYGLVRTNHTHTYFDSVLQQNVTVFDSATLRLGRIDPTTGVVTTISAASLGPDSYTLNGSSTIDPATGTYYFCGLGKLYGVSTSTGALVSQANLTNANGQYFDMIRLHDDCIEATLPTRANPITGLAQPLVSQQLQLFPNPATATVQLCWPVADDARITVTSLTGAVWMAQDVKGKSISLDISLLPRGVYLVQCEAAGQRYTARLVK